MTLAGLYGQEVAKEQLRRALVEGRITHAYLFAGPPGAGKKTAALAWAQALNCPYSRQGDACDFCPACLKLRERSHPDLLWIEPAGQSLKLEQLQEVRRRAVYPPHEGRYLLVVLVRAEELTPEAANALLKLLEEPTAPMVFVLVSDRPEDLLPTIRSRCQTVRFGPLPRAAVLSFLADRGFEGPQAQWAAALAGGNLERAKNLVSGDPKRSVMLRIWSGVWQAPARQRLELAQEMREWEGREVVETFLDWLRDAWVWQRTGRKDLLHHPDLPEHLPRRLPSPEKLAALRRRLVGARKALDQNVQRQLLWEVLLLRWPQIGLEEGRSGSGKDSRGPVPASRKNILL